MILLCLKSLVVPKISFLQKGNFMAERGGSSTVAGVEYQAWVAAEIMVDALFDEAMSVQLEGKADKDGKLIIIDDIIVYKSSDMKYFNCKHQAPGATSWTISELKKQKVLDQLQKQYLAKPNQSFLFITESPCPIMQEGFQRSSASSSIKDAGVRLGCYRKDWEDARKYMRLTEDEMIRFTRHVKYERKTIEDIRKNIYARVHRDFRNSKGIPVILKSFAQEVAKRGQTVNKTEIISYLEENGCYIKSFYITNHSSFDFTQYDKINRLLKFYLARLDTQKNVDKFLDGSGGYLVITGDPGSGKSAFAANLIRQKEKLDGNVVFHFIEPTRRDWKAIISSFIHQFQKKYGKQLRHTIIMPSEDFEDDQLIQVYREVLSLINNLMKKNKQKLLVVIDALDELVPLDNESPVKNLFEFIPSTPDFNHIFFLITTRQGNVFENFKLRMKDNIPEEFNLGHMTSPQIGELAVLHGIILKEKDIERIISVSDGNPLYLSVIFQQMRKDEDYNISLLPKDIMNFFKSDLINKYDIENNDLLKNLLAVMLVLKVPFSDYEFSQIFGITAKEIRSRALNHIACYLSRSQQRSYSFFHLKFAESLTDGENPIIDYDDIKSAHRKVIQWCEPFEKLDDSDSRFRYGIKHLPHHYWHLGEIDNFSGFLELLGRGNLQCEIACRSFLREMVTARSERDILVDYTFRKRFIKLFLYGNNFARYGLLNLSDDLSGFGYTQLKEELWDEIIANFSIGDDWFDEIMINTLSLKKQRLDISLKRIQALHKYTDTNKKRYLRRYYHIAGVIYCTVENSKEIFDSRKGLELLGNAMEILESTIPAELLSISYMDIKYAQYRLSHLKGAFLNDYAISLRRAGEIDVALDYYHRAINIYEFNIDQIQVPFLRNRLFRSIALTKHNLGHLMVLRGNYPKAVELFNDAILFRAKNRMRSAFLVTLEQILFMLYDLNLKSLSIFLRYLLHVLISENQLSRRTKISSYGYHFDYLLEICDLDQAQSVAENMESLRKEESSYANLFCVHRDNMKVSIAQQKEDMALTHLEAALAILSKHDEGNIMYKSGRNYFTFWGAAVKACLLNKQFDRAGSFLFEKIEPWFKEYDFKSLLPRFYELEALYKESRGDNDKANKLRALSNALIEEGQKTISQYKLPGEAMQYLDYLVEIKGDDNLSLMYKNVRERLAHGFVAPDEIACEL